MNYKLGKLPYKYDYRTLKLKRYIQTLPAPKPFIDHHTKLPSNLGMMLNDQLGCCGIAGMAHLDQSWTANANKKILTVPDDIIKETYFKLSPDHQDSGTILLDNLKYWKNVGFGGDKIEGFMELGAADVNQAMLSNEYFGGCYLGLALPDNYDPSLWEKHHPKASISTDIYGRPDKGHCIIIIDHDLKYKMFITISWGQEYPMSFEYFQKYNDENWAVLNDLSIIQATGKTPEGFNMPQLHHDLQLFRNAA